MSTITPVMFDKYLLLDKIAVGGMAEVYRAKLIGEKGFEKPVVVKKLLPHLIEDKDMENLLIDEARLAAQLEHDNIIHVHDFGISSDTLFIAMEYLFGKDLNQIIKRGRETSRPVDLENTLYIISRVCEGLAYAHRLKDLEGNHLGVIHRDVSPHNVFITYEGQVKLIDFGIAKAANRSTKTQTGIIKGKVAYMSPEQAEGKEIDHRSDIFPVGIMLYELLTRQKMFAGDTFQVLSKVIRADYDPPEEIVPGLPDKLYQIIHNALQRNPDDRYASCEAMADDIQDCIYDLQLRPGLKTMAVYVQSLYEGQYTLEQQQMAEKLKAGLPDEDAGRPAGGADSDYQATEVVDLRSAGSAGTRETSAEDRLSAASQTTANTQASGDDTGTDLWGNDGVTLEIGYTDVKGATAGGKGVSTGGEGIAAGEPGSPKKRHPAVWVAVVCLLVAAGLAAAYFWQQPDEKTLKINQHLQAAEESLQEGRVLSPVNDCSLFHYREVLNIDPDNRKAKEGLRKVVNECIRLAENDIDAADIQSARNYLQAGRSIDPENQRIRDLEDQIKNKEIETAKKPDPPARESSGQPDTRTKVEREVKSVVNRVKGIFK